MADTITVPALPRNAAQFSAWKEAVRNKVVAASGRSREAFLWMLDVEDVSITYERLAGRASRWTSSEPPSPTFAPESWAKSSTALRRKRR